MFGTASALNLESVIEESVVNKGWRGDIPIPLGALQDVSTTPIPISGATKPDIVALATSVWGLKWDATDAATDFMEFSITLPGDWAQDQDDLLIVLPARVRGASQTGLGLQAQIFAFQPGRFADPSAALTDTAPTLTAGESSLVTLTTEAKSLVPYNASATSSNLTGFGFIELDIGERLRAESKHIKAGSTIRVQIGPTATLDSSVVLDTFAPIIRYRKHANQYNKRDRWMDKPIV